VSVSEGGLTAGRAAAHLLTYPFRAWGFGEGIGVRALLEAARVLGDPGYEAFTRGLFSAWLGRGGPATFEDHVAPGYELLELYERTSEPALLDAARRLAALHARFPVQNGVCLHRPDQPGFRRQIWVDCMHIDGPFLARLGRITGEAAYFDRAAEAVLGYARLLQQPDGLFRHGWEAACGVNGQPWARGNGWALMGMIDTAAELPSGHAALPELRERIALLVAALRSTQDPCGLWHTVIDDDATYLETTLAVMVATSIPDGQMRSAAEAAVLRHVDEAGELMLVSEATPVAEKRMYATRPFGVFPWGQGPLVLLLCQIAKRI
jgi:unsaturated rhamnogalacturonyl hydrolase